MNSFEFSSCESVSKIQKPPSTGKPENLELETSPACFLLEVPERIEVYGKVK